MQHDLKPGGQRGVSVLFLLVNVVVKQFDNQVHVRKDHAPATVSLATKLVKCIPVDSKLVRKLLLNWEMKANSPESNSKASLYLRGRDVLFVNQIQIFVPLVSHNLVVVPC